MKSKATIKLKQFRRSQLPEKLRNRTDTRDRLGNLIEGYYGYKVVQIKNLTAPSVGNIISRDEVEKLIKDEIDVTIT